MVESNKKYVETMNFAGLADQVDIDIDHFVPKATRDLEATFEAANPNEKLDDLIEYASTQIATEAKRKFKLTGVFSSQTSKSAILGSHFLKVSVPGKGLKYLYSHDPMVAYKKLFTNAFAGHENLRISQEIMFAPQYKLSNLEILHVPDTAIADFDILVPVRDTKGALKTIRSYAPTPANIAKYGHSGYLSAKQVSAETRSLLNFQNLSAKSPSFD